MPEVEIRPAVSVDIPFLVELEHACQSQYVWQMERTVQDTQVNVAFREIRLPRAVRVEYPHRPAQLIETWKHHSGLLVGAVNGKPAAYVALNEKKETSSVWMSDLVVDERWRRQGIGTAMMLAAQEWAMQRSMRRLILELPSKNGPAIHLAIKLGFEFSGYHDMYFANQDIALFFARYLR